MSGALRIVIFAWFVVAYEPFTCVCSMIAGPYEIKTNFAGPCPKENNDPDSFSISIKKVRDRRNPQYFFMNANFTANFVLDDYKDAVVEFASWGSGGGWKENALVMKFKKVCKTLHQYVPAFWRDVRSHLSSDTPTLVRDDCPYQPGSYYLRNVSSATFQPQNMPALFYGKWRVDGKVVDPKLDHATVACTRVYVDIVPKQPRHS